MNESNCCRNDLPLMPQGSSHDKNYVTTHCIQYAINRIVHEFTALQNIKTRKLDDQMLLFTCFTRISIAIEASQTRHNVHKYRTLQ